MRIREKRTQRKSNELIRAKTTLSGKQFWENFSLGVGFFFTRNFALITVFKYI